MNRKTKIKALLTDGDLSEILRGGGVFLLVKLLGMAAAYLLAWYISRQYGPEGNGILSFALTGAVFLAAIYNLGLNVYAVRIIPLLSIRGKGPAIRSFYQSSLLVIILVLTAGTLLLSLIGKSLQDETLARDLTLVNLVTVPLTLLLFTSHVFKARKQIFGFSLLQNNIVQGVACLFLFLFFPSGKNPSEPVYALAMAAGLLMLLSLVGNISFLKEIRFDPPDRIKKTLRDAWPMLSGGLAFMVLNLTDRLMLRFLDTVPQLGVYDIVFRLSNLTLVGLLSLNAIAEPKFSEIFAGGDRERLKKTVRRTTFTGIWLSIPVILLLALFPRFILGLFDTDGAFLTGSTTLYILLGGHLISVLCGAVLIVLNMTGNQRSVQMILITTTLLNILLNAILIPVAGIEGAAWATAFSTLVWNIWGWRMVRKKLGFSMWG